MERLSSFAKKLSKTNQKKFSKLLTLQKQDLEYI